MKAFENILLALSGLRSSKMRSFLTMLGIIIGIGSVIAIVTVGNSLTGTITGAMEDLGANQIFVFVTTKEANTSPKMEDSDLFTEDMIEDFEEQFADKIIGVNLQEYAPSGQAKSGRRYANVEIAGTNENYLVRAKQPIVQGRDISKRDVQRASNVAVVSDKFIEKMFAPGVDPIGQEVKIHTKTHGVLTFKIVGVYHYKVPAIAANFVNDEDVSTQMAIPVTTAKKIMDKNEFYSQFSVMFPPEADSQALADEIEEFFANYYRSNTYFTAGTQNMQGMMDQFTTILGTLSIAVAIIAAISLLVGGIGVMNIMLVSVTERTREIGTRKALGAKNSDIRSQFIVESVILCLIGGIIGVALGMSLGAFGASLLNASAAPSVPAIVVAVLFSMAIGIFFGYYPANKAAQLDPIEALRYE